MASKYGEQQVLDQGSSAAADLSSKQFYGVSIDSNGDINVPSVRGAQSFGALQDKPESGEAGAVRAMGNGFMLYNDTIVIGDALAMGSDGRAVKAASGDAPMAIALEAGTASTSAWHPVFICAYAKPVNTVVLPLGNWNLSQLDNMNVADVLPLDFKGKVIRMYATVTTATSDNSGKQAILTAKLTPAGGSLTTVTSCVLTIDTDVTAADPDTLGKMIQGVEATGAQTFAEGDTLSVVASNTTPFTAGAVNLFLVCEQ